MKYHGLASTLTIGLTLVLFLAALFLNGFTHDVLLEAGVFLVSVKLILAAHKSKMDLTRIEEKLDLIIKKTSK